jgi:hypothetical protein
VLVNRIMLSLALGGGIAAALAAPLLLVGCAGIHLHNPGRETTAKGVKTKYAESVASEDERERSHQ